MQITLETLSGLLSLVEATGFNPSIVAGGAVRDTLLDRPVKDIDVFERRAQSLATALGGKLEVRSEWVQYPNAYSIADITGTAFGVPIQIIGLFEKDPIADVEHYDAGICQCWVTANSSEAKMTDSCRHDIANKTITYFGDAGLRNEKRVARLKEKFPDFEFVEALS
jgi:hypothetical protein